MNYVDTDISSRAEFNGLSPPEEDHLFLLVERALIERGIKTIHMEKFRAFFENYADKIEKPILVDWDDNLETAEGRVDTFDVVHFQPAEIQGNLRQARPIFERFSMGFSGLSRIRRELPIEINLGRAGYRYIQGTCNVLETDHEDMRYALVTGLALGEVVNLKRRRDRVEQTGTIIPHKDGLFLGYIEDKPPTLSEAQIAVVYENPDTNTVIRQNSLPGLKMKNNYTASTSILTFVPYRDLDPAQERLWEYFQPFLTTEKEQNRIDTAWMSFTGGPVGHPETKRAFKIAKGIHEDFRKLVKTDLWNDVAEGVYIRIMDRLPELKDPSAGLMTFLDNTAMHTTAE